jgi:hypothetical protein
MKTLMHASPFYCDRLATKPARFGIKGFTEQPTLPSTITALQKITSW